MSETYKVCLLRCPDYEPDHLKKAISTGLKLLNAQVKGKVAIKPNLVFAHAKMAPSAFTRPEVVAALLETVKSKDITNISIVEKSGVGVSTHVIFKRAGYFPLAEQYGVTLSPIEEDEKVRVPLTRSIVHQSLLLSKKMIEADTLIFMPKLKSNVLSHGITAALKLNIGSLDDKERMWHHDHLLDEKIVDILEGAHPGLIITDAVEIALGGNQMTEHGHHLGLIILATNPLAHDIVAASVLNLNPGQIGHLQAAIKRGYGPSSLDEIELLGDYPLDELQAKTAAWSTGMIRVEDFPSPLKIQVGSPYCTGGCHGIFLDWLYMLKDRTPQRLNRLPAIPALIGRTENEIRAPQILVIGDCAARSPHLHGKQIRIPGCPPTHRDIILKMGLRTFVPAPFIRAEMVWESYAVYPWRKLLSRKNRRLK